MGPARTTLLVAGLLTLATPAVTKKPAVVPTVATRVLAMIVESVTAEATTVVATTVTVMTAVKVAAAVAEVAIVGWQVVTAAGEVVTVAVELTE